MTDECTRCGTCCRLIASRVKSMSPKELAFLTTRGIYVHAEDDCFWVVHQQDCIMRSGVLCTLHYGAKPEVCRKANCLKGESWFDGAVKYYFSDHDYVRRQDYEGEIHPARASGIYDD